MNVDVFSVRSVSTFIASDAHVHGDEHQVVCMYMVVSRA